MLQFLCSDGFFTPFSVWQPKNYLFHWPLSTPRPNLWFVPLPTHLNYIPCGSFLSFTCPYSPFNHELLKDREPVLLSNACFRLAATVYNLNRLKGLCQIFWVSFYKEVYLSSWVISSLLKPLSILACTTPFGPSKHYIQTFPRNKCGLRQNNPGFKKECRTGKKWGLDKYLLTEDRRVMNDMWEIFFKLGTLAYVSALPLYSWVFLSYHFICIRFIGTIWFYFSLVYFLNTYYVACTRPDSRYLKMNKTQFLTSSNMVGNRHIDKKLLLKYLWFMYASTYKYNFLIGANLQS